MTTRRAVLVALGAGVLAAPLAPLAQTAGKVVRIGVLHPGSTAAVEHRLPALRTGLRELGYREGKNLAFESRGAEGSYDRVPALVAELVRAKVDVIVTFGPAVARVTKQATATIPIVALAGDVLATGLVESLARPGGNLTGVTIFSPELSAKRIELLMAAVPRAKQVAILLNPANPASAFHLEEMARTAKALGVGLQHQAVREPKEFAAAFAAAARQRADAVVVAEDAIFNVNPGAIVALAAKYRLPAAGNKEFAEAGGLIGYGVDFDASTRRLAYFVDRILKGARPADLPVERASRFWTVLNLKTARALGIRVPQELLLRADGVVE